MGGIGAGVSEARREIVKSEKAVSGVETPGSRVERDMTCGIEVRWRRTWGTCTYLVVEKILKRYVSRGNITLAAPALVLANDDDFPASYLVL